MDNCRKKFRVFAHRVNVTSCTGVVLQGFLGRALRNRPTITNQHMTLFLLCLFLKGGYTNKPTWNPKREGSLKGEDMLDCALGQGDNF